MKIKGIIFDFGFTLFYFENPSVERYYECFKKGLLKSIDLLKEQQIWDNDLSDELFVNNFIKEREYFFRKSITTKTEFPTSLVFKHVLELFKEKNIIRNIEHLKKKTFEKLAEIYHSCEEEEWIPFENTRETLEKLVEYNLKIALISNHPNHKTIENLLKKHDFLKFFNFIITSAKFGRRKPDPNIFLHTIDKIGLKSCPNSVIMCGDEYADIIGAQRANLQTILFERKYKFTIEKEINIPDLKRITDISEILAYIV
ncbi:MAG: HAD family hydrolase [Promethearchaeota archaeon]